MTARSNRDRPPYPAASNAAPIQDTWRCPVCGVVRGLRTGWRIEGTGKARRRVCRPCFALKYGDK